jgi:hypothetical protein
MGRKNNNGKPKNRTDFSHILSESNKAEEKKDAEGE